MNRPSHFLRKTSSSDSSPIEITLPKNSNQKFEQPKTRNIARETVTIHTGGQLRKAMDEINIEPPKQKADRKPSKLPLLKRDSTYIVNPNSITIKNVTNQNSEPPKSKLVQVMPKNEPAPKITNKAARKPLVRQTSENKTADIDSSIENNQPEAVQMPKIKSLSSFKQQKRDEIKRFNEKSHFANNFEMPEVNMIGNKSLETIVDNARKSGQLNLSDYGLTEIPTSIWQINIEKFDDKKNAGVSMDGDGNRWWEQVELQKLILASNKLKTIPKMLKNLQTLVTLDIHNNQLERIDEAIGELSLLQSLNLSHNYLATLPNGISKLKYLKTLNISHNKLKQLPKDFGHLDDLEDLDLSNNCLAAIPKSFGWLLKLRRLNLSTNSLRNLIPEIFYSRSLRLIDISENQIVYIPEEIGDLDNLEQLFLRQNKIQKLILLNKCCKLKDWDISFNKLTEIDEDLFNNLVSLVNFNLRDNQLNSLPKSIKDLQSLERLDVSNNNLSGLPCELALIEPLKQILLSGNILRAIRKDIVNRGTVAIMKHLRNQLAEDADNNAQNPEKDILRSDIVKSTKVFDLSGKKLTNITAEMVSFCQKCTALVFNASKNILQDLPNELELLNNQLTEMNLSMNKFTQIPRAVFSLESLTTLDLRGNQLAHVPFEIKYLSNLRELSVADNKLTEISPGIYELPVLENLFVSNNRINTIDPFRIINMRHLATLNLQNNDLMQIPIELGKATQIKSLPLDGNPFRLPAPRILAKGTTAVLEYLRGRMVEP